MMMPAEIEEATGAEPAPPEGPPSGPPPGPPPAPRTLLEAARICFPGHSGYALRYRARFVLAGLRHRRLIRPFLAPEPGTALARTMAGIPKTIGALVWPYQCASWGVGMRLGRIQDHCRELDRLGPPYAFGMDEKLVLLDWPETDGLRLVLDQPKWFLREGGFALNLFQGDFRAMTIAFSLYRPEGGPLEILIGCLQGRDREGILDLYRDLTKRMHGLRPRDLLFECLRGLCRHLGVGRILAVADEDRHHRHPFFGATEFPTEYNEIWADRGGRRIDWQTFELPLARVERDMSEIKPKKRSLYRRRYAFLAELDQTLPAGIDAVRPSRFEAS